MSSDTSTLRRSPAFWSESLLSVWDPRFFPILVRTGRPTRFGFYPWGLCAHGRLGEDSTDIKVGTPASLTLDAEGKVVRINLSGKKVDQTALPMNVTGFDFEEKLEITGLVLDELKTYAVDHDATIVEEDGTEVRIAPLDVQYQNASIWGRLITNFAGPMNNFILSVLVFMLLAFVQGGVQDENSNHFQVMDGSAIANAGVQK